MRLGIVTLLAVSGLAHGGEFVLQSPETQVHLVELYSSEGCSSCPPADAWLSTLRRDAGLWKNFVPVEFHVDYWNRLGWHDKFSKSQFTDRQHAYAKEWRAGTVYTPGFVLDGTEWRRQPVPDRGEKVGVLRVARRADGDYDVRFTPRTPGRYTVTGALLGNGLASKVTSGENRGETLKHEFVALKLTSSPLAPDGTAVVKLPRADVDAKVASYSVGFWVSKAGEQRPIQAVGGDL